MSGIAGILRFDGSAPPRERLVKMLAHLRHRGPEGQGIAALGPCSLATTKLSVVDVVSGDQPMSIGPASDACDDKCASLGPLHIVFNGEIYNHRSLREKLQKRGHRFVSDHADTEVLLLGYRQWGTRLPKHIHGMFAFAIWDQEHQQLFLCRDRPGKKPLYFRRNPEEFAFASLIGSLLESAGSASPPGIDREAMGVYLRYGCTFGRSLVQGVEEVPPTHWMTVDARGNIALERYWQPPPISRSSTSLGATDALREVLIEAVHTRMESDKPIGCFLSGGINSSIVAALAQQKRETDGLEPLKTFSVSIPDLSYDESRHAEAVASHIGSHHETIRANAGDVIDDLRRLIGIYGEPVVDAKALTNYWLCRAARRYVSVALTGIGGDELFGGHDRYQRMARWQKKDRWARVIPGVDSPVRSPAVRYHAMVRLLDEHQIARLGLADLADRGSQPGVDGWLDEPDYVHAAMRWDLEHTLPCRVLRRVDRTSMAVALEMRCPLLATQVEDLAGHLPTHVLMPGGRPSGLLREVGLSLLPANVLDRPRQDFPLPLGAWFRSTLRKPLMDLLTRDAVEQLGLDAGEVMRWLKEHDSGEADRTRPILAVLGLVLWDGYRKNPEPAPVFLHDGA